MLGISFSKLLDGLFTEPVGAQGVPSIDTHPMAALNYMFARLSNLESKVSALPVASGGTGSGTAAGGLVGVTDTDTLERTSSSSLGTTWLTSYSGGAGIWATPNGHDATFATSGTQDREFLCIRNNPAILRSATDYQRVTSELSSKSTRFYDAILGTYNYCGHGMWLHDSTLTMVDVEGDQGRIRGDQSAEVNDEINRMRGWYGNQRRVIGYWNPNADSGLWLKRPYALELVIPQYNGRPGDLTGVTQNTVAREAFAHQYTDRATDVMPWPGQPVDMNWTPYNLAELYSVFGLPEAIKEPDTGGPLDLSTSDIEELCGAIGAQFNA